MKKDLRHARYVKSYMLAPAFPVGVMWKSGRHYDMADVPMADGKYKENIEAFFSPHNPPCTIQGDFFLL